MKMRARRRGTVWQPRRNVMLNTIARMLKRRQQLDGEEVEQGLRTARSLWVIQPGDLAGFSFRSRPDSQFLEPGEGW